MSFPEIPADTAARVKRLFRGDNRKKIAMELLFFDHWPTTDERKEISGRYGLEHTTVDKVLYKLRDSDFFTKEQGSIPLYRVRLRSEVPEVEQDREDLQDKTVSVSVPEDDKEEEKPHQDDVEPSDDPDEEELEKIMQDNRLKKMEVTIHNQGEKVDNFMAEMRTTINQLSTSPPKDNPGHIENPDQTDLAPPESIEGRLERIERIVQEGSGGDPFDNLSREQIIELIRSQPQELMTMANPDGRGLAGRVEGQKVTLRPMILMLTTYSQMLYERAVYDGHFEGTLSDFANFTMEQYFTDRGWGLDWSKREPANLRRHG